MFCHELSLQTDMLQCFSPRAEADCRPWPLAVVMDDNLERLKAERDQLKRSLKEASKVLKLEAGQS